MSARLDIANSCGLHRPAQRRRCSRTRRQVRDQYVYKSRAETPVGERSCALPIWTIAMAVIAKDKTKPRLLS